MNFFKLTILLFSFSQCSSINHSDHLEEKDINKIKEISGSNEVKVISKPDKSPSYFKVILYYPYQLEDTSGMKNNSHRIADFLKSKKWIDEYDKLQIACIGRTQISKDTVDEFYFESVDERDFLWLEFDIE